MKHKMAAGESRTQESYKLYDNYQIMFRRITGTFFLTMKIHQNRQNTNKQMCQIDEGTPVGTYQLSDPHKYQLLPRFPCVFQQHTLPETNPKTTHTNNQQPIPTNSSIFLRETSSVHLWRTWISHECVHHTWPSNAVKESLTPEMLSQARLMGLNGRIFGQSLVKFIGIHMSNANPCIWLVVSKILVKMGIFSK